MGTFVGAAAIGVAIDHTRHRLPEPQPAQQEQSAKGQSTVIVVDGDENATPCGLDASPCSLDDNPCSIGDAGDGADESPCSL